MATLGLCYTLRLPSFFVRVHLQMLRSYMPCACKSIRAQNFMTTQPLCAFSYIMDIEKEKIKCGTVALFNACNQFPFQDKSSK